MNTVIPYDKTRPLMRLEKYDNAVIHVNHMPTACEKDKQKYKDVPNGIYPAVCTSPFRLECKKYPVLSGAYNYWRGDKWGCSEGIYGNEVTS